MPSAGLADRRMCVVCLNDMMACAARTLQADLGDVDAVHENAALHHHESSTSAGRSCVRYRTSVALTRRNMEAKSVDLPAPVRPTTPTFSLRGTDRRTLERSGMQGARLQRALGCTADGSRR